MFLLTNTNFPNWAANINKKIVSGRPDTIFGLLAWLVVVHVINKYNILVRTNMYLLENEGERIHEVLGRLVSAEPFTETPMWNGFENYTKHN